LVLAGWHICCVHHCAGRYHSASAFFFSTCHLFVYSCGVGGIFALPFMPSPSPLINSSPQTNHNTAP
jgi:hypothetical protein